MKSNIDNRYAKSLTTSRFTYLLSTHTSTAVNQDGGATIETIGNNRHKNPFPIKDKGQELQTIPERNNMAALDEPLIPCRCNNISCSWLPSIATYIRKRRHPNFDTVLSHVYTKTKRSHQQGGASVVTSDDILVFTDYKLRKPLLYESGIIISYRGDLDSTGSWSYVVRLFSTV